MVEELVIYHKHYYINYLIQYLLLYKVIDFFAVLFFGVLFGRGVVVMCLLGFVCFASALFYVYACEYCFCFVLCICLYAGYVYVCELGGSFAGASSSLALQHIFSASLRLQRGASL